jgi:adenylate cyclase
VSRSNSAIVGRDWGRVEGKGRVVKKLRLRPIILILFAVLTVPVVVAIVAINYIANDRTARANAYDLVERFRGEALQNIQNTFDPIKSLVRSAAEVGEASPGFYGDNGSLPYLLTILRHSDRMVAMYVGQEDGSFRQARRLVADRGVDGDPAPPESEFALRWMPPLGGDGQRLDNFAYLDEAGQLLGQASRATGYDPRVRPWYRQTVEAGELYITDPSVFAIFDLIGFTVSAPYHDGDRLLGVAAVDITLDGLSDYLAENRISPGTRSYILDHGGRVIANSEGARTYATRDGQLEIRHVTSLEEELPAIAFSARPRDGSDRLYTFRHGGREYVATLSTLKPEFGKRWQLFIVTPIHEFTAALEKNNIRLLALGLGALVLQILIIWVFSGVVSKPLERLAMKVSALQEPGRNDSPPLDSSIREVAVLSRAVETLDKTVRSFAAFVPWGLVRQLVDSERKLELGGQSRFLTIFFSDLESFSTLSEELPSRELMLRVSAYLETVTRAVNREAGTIDKFIGDGVMAFWGAPNLLEDHAWHACVAAMRIQREMVAVNERWTGKDDRPLNVRIGIHSDAVLVGNVGSAERMSYTVMGDGVNVAARLEGINKVYGTRVCISHSVFKEAGDRLLVRPIEDVAVKGRRTTIPIYELLGVRGAAAELEPDERAVILAEMTRRAYNALVAGDKEAALRHYREVLASFPEDTVARRMIASVEATMQDAAARPPAC